MNVDMECVLEPRVIELRGILIDKSCVVLLCQGVARVIGRGMQYGELITVDDVVGGDAAEDSER